MSDERPPEIPRVKARLPFDENAFSKPRSAQRGAVLLFAILAVGLAGVAYYMGAIVRHPLMSPYVIAPAVGAAWFGLRVFMMIAPRN